MSRLVLVCAGVALCALLGGLGSHQPTKSTPGVPAGTVEGPRPEDPTSYLLVGETLARDPERRLLARETLAVGALLASERGENAAAASMIIAIASLADDAESSRGLWMLALTLDPDRGDSFRWLGALGTPDEQDSAEAGRVLGLLRRNDPDALREINDTHRGRIVREARALGFDAGRVTGVLRKWENDAANDPCKGRLFVRVRAGDGIVASVCPLPGFHHGSVFNEDWAMMSALELSLVGHTPASWTVRGSIGLDRPVPIWTLERLSTEFGVSADRPVQRGGRWVTR